MTVSILRKKGGSGIENAMPVLYIFSRVSISEKISIFVVREFSTIYFESISIARNQNT